MNQPLHARLPLEDLAASHRSLSGRVDAAELAARLAEALGRDAAEGDVHYELAFAPGADGATEIRGALQARLVAQCQRCLQPFKQVLDVPVQLVLPGPEGAGEAGQDWEIGPRDARPTLAEVIEEELLLALPFLPRHPAEQCPAAPRAEARVEGPRQRPFAGLDEVLRRGED